MVKFYREKMLKNKLSRRNFLAISTIGVTGLLTTNSKSLPLTEDKNKKNMLVYIGTYTSNSKSEGIYIYKLNGLTGELTPYKTVPNVVDPSFLTISKDRKFLYAVNELEKFEGKKSGAVSAFAINDKTGDLQFLNKQATLGGSPCQLSVSENGKFVAVANYSGGNASIFPVETDGSLGLPTDFIQHTGFGPNKTRQASAHVHSINLDHKNNFAFVCDLGIDKVMIYAFDDKKGKLQPNSFQPFFQAKPGSGPRHFVFHPHNKFAFVVNEIDDTVTALAYNAEKGSLNELQTVSTLPVNYSRSNTCADIHISPNGEFLYASNRGHDSIVSFQIDQKTGLLTYLEHTPTQGKNPRNFAIDASGNFLIVANQTTENIIVFRINQSNGKLEPTGFSANVPAPVCLKLIPEFTS